MGRDASRDREHPQANTFRFPPTCFVVGEPEHLCPCRQVQSELDDGQPDAVLVEPVQREVGQSGVLGGADTVFAAGAAAVPQFESP